MKFCLIRHGETDWNKAGRLQGREDIPLNAQGCAQAAAVGDCLLRSHWDIIVTSPLLRASQTAKIIAHRLGIAEIAQDPCFIERDYGGASGLTMEERTQRYPNRQYEGMEDWNALRGRMMDGLNRCVEAYAGRNIVIVSHGSAINSVLATLSDGAIGTGKTRLVNACMNMLRYQDGNYSIEYYNQSVENLMQAHTKTED